MADPRLPKYEPLRRYLAGLAAERVTLSFAELEAVLGCPLPASAGARAWWTNQARLAAWRGWGAAGWRVLQADPYRRVVTFVRVSADG